MKFVTGKYDKIYIRKDKYGVTLPKRPYIICLTNGSPNTLNQIQSGASRCEGLSVNK